MVRRASLTLTIESFGIPKSGFRQSEVQIGPPDRRAKWPRPCLLVLLLLAPRACASEVRNALWKCGGVFLAPLPARQRLTRNPAKKAVSGVGGSPDIRTFRRFY